MTDSKKKYDEWFKNIDIVNGKNKVDEFKLYCINLLHEYEMDKIDKNQMSYRICSAVRYLELQEWPYEEVIGLACNLELPIKHQLGDARKNWERMIKLIKDFGDKKE